MTKYAANTTVSVDKSRAEIEATLGRYGADAFGYMYRDQTACIEFQADGRHVRFVLPLPSRDDDEFRLTPTGKGRSSDAAYKSWEQACRQKWRALALAIKAKLECVESGISEFEREFFAHIVEPGSGRTVYEIVAPQVEKSYLTGEPTALMLEDKR